MFTGVIEATAEVRAIEKGKLNLARPSFYKDVKLGSSIAVSGACLTITKLTKTAMEFGVVPETLKKTKLGSLKKGDRVNLERAMRADGRFEGHIVQGHVEGVGMVNAISGKRSAASISIDVPPSLVRFIVEKGSIAFDGVSLTVASVHGRHVTVALIPHTLAETTLGRLRKGDRVNVETDILGRYVRSFLSHR